VLIPRRLRPSGGRRALASRRATERTPRIPIWKSMKTPQRETRRLVGPRDEQMAVPGGDIGKAANCRAGDALQHSAASTCWSTMTPHQDELQRPPERESPKRNGSSTFAGYISADVYLVKRATPHMPRADYLNTARSIRGQPEPAPVAYDTTREPSSISPAARAAAADKGIRLSMPGAGPVWTELIPRPLRQTCGAFRRKTIR